MTVQPLKMQLCPGCADHVEKHASQRHLAWHFHSCVVFLRWKTKCVVPCLLTEADWSLRSRTILSAFSGCVHWTFLRAWGILAHERKLCEGVKEKQILVESFTSKEVSLHCQVPQGILSSCQETGRIWPNDVLVIQPTWKMCVPGLTNWSDGYICALACGVLHSVLPSWMLSWRLWENSPPFFTDEWSQLIYSLN